MENGSITSSHVQPMVKRARLIPTLKKPALHSSDIINYRLLSLHALFLILECTVYNQLSDYLSKTNLQEPNQCGKAAHSTETAHFGCR